MAVLYFIFAWVCWIKSLFIRQRNICFKKKAGSDKLDIVFLENTKPKGFAKNRKKEKWVVDKILYLLAVSGYGCGTVAQLFNQGFGHRETVSKSFVYDKMKKHRYDIQVIRRNIKTRPPRRVPINHTWGLDLTTVSLSKQQKLMLGIVEHGSRLNLKLSELKSKHSAVILMEICSAIREFGFPKTIRTDNEHCFTSCWLRWGLKLLGIKHQTTDIACPWMNGRIERFFGTFKEKIKQVVFTGTETLQTELDVYRTWYNVIRPHQNLNGLTPAEAFTGKLNRHKDNAVEISAWEGLLTGYYFPD